MNNLEGWVCLHRKILENIVFYNPETLQLFLYLLLMANHKPGKKFGIEIKRGQFLTGRKSLSLVLKQKESAVYKRLRWLQKNDIILLNSNNKNTIVTICNYEEYQEKKTTKGQQGNNKVTTEEQQGNTNNNVNNNNNENNYSDEFESFWTKYGKHGNKKTASEKYSKLSQKQKNEMLSKVDDYIKSTPEIKYRKLLQTYLNKGKEYWNDKVVFSQTNLFDSVIPDYSDPIWETKIEIPQCAPGLIMKAIEFINHGRDRKEVWDFVQRKIK